MFHKMFSRLSVVIYMGSTWKIKDVSSTR